MFSGFPLMCMRTSAALALRTTAAIFLSPVSALMSLIISAPASSAFCATCDLVVSTDTGIFRLPDKLSTTGTILAISCRAVTGDAPGLDDSPPISIMSAPSSAICKPLSTAFRQSKKQFPSENESGVTFKTPIIRVLSPRTIFLFDVFRMCCFR